MGSKSIRSDVTLPTTSFSGIFWHHKFVVIRVNEYSLHKRHDEPCVKASSFIPSQSILSIWKPGGLHDHVRNEQRCCSPAEWLQEALQKSCIRAGCSSSKFWLFRAAVESPLTAINSAFAAVQKIPESRSALQSGCKVASKRQRTLLPVMAYHSLVQKKEMQTSIIQ